MRSMAMALASPPPMHSAATPRFRFCASSACSSVTIRRAPVAPIGWPSAQAPPLMLSLSRGMPRSRCAAIATTANASLISNRSTSPTPQPTLSSSLRIAGIGAVVNHCGSWLWVAWPLITARGGRPSGSASDRFVNISAAAPSAFAEEAAGVIVPVARNAGFRPGILAGSTLRGISSLPMLRGPAFSVTVIGTISALNAPPSTALRARVRVFHGVGVLVCAGKLIGLGGSFAKIAHRAPALIGVFEAVHHHVIDNPVMTGAIAGARFCQQVGRVGHALHAAGHHDFGGAGLDDVVGQHGGLHAGTADLVDGGGASRIRQFGAAGGLPRRRLALSGWQHAAHEHFVDPLRRKLRPLDRGADHMGTELVRAERRQIAHEPAKRGAGGGNDDDRIGGCGHGGCSFEFGKAIYCITWII